MRLLASYVNNCENLNGLLLLQLGATVGQIKDEYDHRINQDDARNYKDNCFNRKAFKLARTYRRDIVDAIKKKGSKWLIRYKNYRPEPLLIHFDGNDFWLLDNPQTMERVQH